MRTPSQKKERPVGLAMIFAAFVRIGATSFGGGLAAWLYRDIVQRRHWLDDRTFLAEFAMGQTVPGSNGVKLTVQIGQRLHRFAGAAAALIGLLTVPFAIALLLGVTYERLGEHRVVHHMLDGVAAAVIGLTFATGLRSALRGVTGTAGLALTAITALGVGLLAWPILPVVLGVGTVSIALAFARRAR